MRYGNPCYYCGEPSNSVDHVLPVSMRAAYMEQGYYLEPGELVPACQECNSILGNNLLPTLLDRKQFLKERLEEEYGYVRRMPIWSDEDLDELDFPLKNTVLAREMERRRALARLAW